MPREKQARKLCERCNGARFDDDGRFTPCRMCDGAGHVPAVAPTKQARQVCPDCVGLDIPCTTCHGARSFARAS